ncbi:guanine nucleotide-binding protein subunit alpha [Marasmius crinis-equi]|uniref:Guanine nucleotide-binding protein subunit alpha n=1 Tax=Marasmius crinis-equi TaxID=585013 RepID=A0ABR3F2C0_9AGAR
MQLLESVGLFKGPFGPEYDPAIKERIKSSISTLKALHFSNDSSPSRSINAETWRLLEHPSPNAFPEYLRNIIVKFVKILNGTPTSEKPVKLLLLGVGESGKSTIQKQLIRSYHGSSAFQNVYSNGCQAVLYLNVLPLMRELIDNPRGLDVVVGGSGSILNWAGGLNDDADRLNKLCDIIRAHSLGLAALQAVLDEDDRRRLRALEQLAALLPMERSSWQPSDEELLCLYTTTTGLFEETFQINKRKYNVWDCGGQRSERRKWLNMFKEVRVVVFVVSLIEYDGVLTEAPEVNRMQESLTLFESICNSRWFAESRIVLAFNKLDALERRLRRSPLEIYFPDYKGGTEVKSACEHLKQRFLSTNKQPNKAIAVSFINSLNQAELYFKA